MACVFYGCFQQLQALMTITGRSSTRLQFN